MFLAPSALMSDLSREKAGARTDTEPNGNKRATHRTDVVD